MDFSNIANDLLTQILVAAALLGFILLVVVYSLRYLYVAHKAKKAALKQLTGEEPLPPVSVVLVAHNEAAFLRENLVYLLEQEYPDFEVVVVNYLSHDDTHFVLKLCKDNYPNLKVVDFKDDVNMFYGRKYPLSIGIRSAKNDIIVLTDVDSMPASLHWLQHVVQGYAKPRTNIVLGYGKLEAEKTVLGSLQRYDNMDYSADYLSRALRHRPVTATDRNLSYRKGFFFSKGAFISHYNEPDGAADMFVNQNATRRNTAVNLHPETFIKYKAPVKFIHWHQMRQHRTATYRYHKASQQMAGATAGISLLLFYGSVAALLALGLFPWQILVGVLVLKFALQILSFAQLEKQLGEKGLCWLSPLYEIYFTVANTILLLFPLKYKYKK